MRKFKIINSIFATTSSLVLLTPVLNLTACNKDTKTNQTKFAETAAMLQQDSIDIFKNVVCSVNHPSYDQSKISAIYKKYVNDILGDGAWKEDTYFQQAKADGVQFKTETAYNNAYFDIPASEGCSGWDKIILQGHMDMVEAYPEGKTFGDKVEIVEDTVDGKKVIHSKDYKTSIGADNGAGIALALAMLKNKDKFTHGPIRIIFSADEEPGMIGAKYLPAEWIDSKYLINIDNEDVSQIVKACAGGYSQNWFVNNDNIESVLEKIESTSEKKYYLYSVVVSGLKESHSAEVNENMINAVKAAVSCIFGILRPEDNIYLSSITTPETKVDATNAVPTKCVIDFAVDRYMTSVELLEASEIYQNYVRTTYSEEPNARILISPTGYEEIESLSVIKSSVSRAILYAIDNMKFGPISYVDPETKKVLQTSSNVGPIYVKSGAIGQGLVDQGYSPIMIKFYSRSCDSTEYLDIKAYNDSIKQYLAGVIVAAGCEGLEDKTIAEFPSWDVSKNDNILIDTIADAYKTLGITPTIDVIHGGVEPAWWTNKYKQLHPKDELVVTSVGPTIKGAHTTQETLYVETFNEEIQALLCAMEKMKK